MGSSPSSPLPSTPLIPLPQTLTATYKKSLTKIILLLSPTPASPPLLAAHLAQSWRGDLTLHAGPSTAHPVLAVARWGKGLHRIVPVDLPGGDRQMVRYQGSRRERFWFALGVGEDSRVEKFEWRRSHGAAVKSLGQSSHGWKLVRITALSPSYTEVDEEAKLAADEAPDVDDADSADGLTSDGKEIVAVWAPASARRLSVTAVGRFEFRGAGEGGELGERWRLMAVMSMLVFWRQEMQNVVTASTVASA